MEIKTKKLTEGLLISTNDEDIIETFNSILKRDETRRDSEKILGKPIKSVKDLPNDQDWSFPVIMCNPNNTMDLYIFIYYAMPDDSGYELLIMPNFISESPFNIEILKHHPILGKKFDEFQTNLWGLVESTANDFDVPYYVSMSIAPNFFGFLKTSKHPLEELFKS